MPTTPNRPNMPGGWRQQQAAQLRSQARAQEPTQRSITEEQVGLGDDRMHCIQEGDSLESIADSYDCPAEAIWNHPKNEELRTQRGGAESLAFGDNLYIPTEGDQPPQPVGQGEHVVGQGECISSIAKATGHFWETIWDDPANEELKEVRENPNILLPGDRVTIPEKRRKEEPRETEQRHRFVRRGEPEKLCLRFVEPGPDGDQPRGNVPYVLDVDGQIFEGTTTVDGQIDVLIPGNARKARLRLGEPEDEDEYEFQLGSVDPITELTGIQQRLTNLRYKCGQLDGTLSPQTRSALRQFQRKNELPETGESDPATRARLLELHGS